MERFRQRLNLIPKGTQVSEDKKLELRLGPPGEDQLPLSISYMSSNTHHNTSTHGAKRGFQDIVEAETGEENWLKNTSNENQYHKLISVLSDKPVEKVCSYPWSCGPLSPFPSSSACQEQTQPCNSSVTELECPEKKACSANCCSSNASVPNSSQKRIALGPVVGWPPVRSFRKNLATSSSSKSAPPESPNKIPKDLSGGKSENLGNSLFVKINMDGIPIGRKLDLKSYDNYEKLSAAVDELFRCLLAAQKDSSAALDENETKETKAITGLLDGSGEYTLVYEDNEGDRMLVGDVPWHMFVSSAKRLRVLKKSELSALHLCSSKFEKST